MTRLFVVGLVIAALAVPTVSSVAMAATPTCRGLVATRVGTPGSDLIRGTAGRDVIVARGGNDKILAGGGNDVICAGPGRDVVRGGTGKDRIYGEGGNDTLRGDAGKDVLNGGTGLDGCYAGADGARIVGCEEADLAVTIKAPSVVPEDETFSFSVRVKNVGGKPSTSYDLALAMSRTDVVCGYDPSGTQSYTRLKPGGYYQDDYFFPGGCSALTGSDWHIRFDAELKLPAPDADPTNDKAAARLDITPEVTPALR